MIVAGTLEALYSVLAPKSVAPPSRWTLLTTARRTANAPLPAKPVRRVPIPPVRISANLIDPALHSSSPSDAEAALRTAQAATEVADRADSQWVEKVRLLEYLRSYIASRLERGEYDSDSDDHASAAASPVIKHDGHMDGVESSHKPITAEETSAPPAAKAESNHGVMYPTLHGLDGDEDTKMHH